MSTYFADLQAAAALLLSQLLGLLRPHELANGHPIVTSFVSGFPSHKRKVIPFTALTLFLG